MSAPVDMPTHSEMPPPSTLTSLAALDPSSACFAADILSGFRQSPKCIPCKYLYDAHGSSLFDEICRLEEYYLTRAELEILRARAAELAARISRNTLLVELGSGSSTKTALLLERLHRSLAAYVPIDISREPLLESAENIRATYPHLEVLPVCADYHQPFDLPSPAQPVESFLFFFPGSTIGNFEPSEAARFLERICRQCRPAGGLLIGVDLKKNGARIEAAYNDMRGVTEAFNMNVLMRANRELNAGFDPAKFRHQAVYSSDRGRIEMHLISLADQLVQIGDELFYLADGEPIVTEYSYKYSGPEFRALAETSGFVTAEVWSDPAEFFSVYYLVPRA